MDSREVSLWIESRKYNALRQALEGMGSSLERELLEHLDARYEELVSVEERERISTAIAEEDRAERVQHEANRRFSVARVTEGGQSHICLCERGENLFGTALQLRRYLRGRSPDVKLYQGQLPLIELEMERYVAEAISGSPRVVGIYDINLDAGEISTLDDKVGWRTYRIKDVSTAVYFATKKESDSWVAQRNRFDERMKDVQPLDIQHPIFIRGDQPLPVASITFEQEVYEMDHMLNFYIPVYFNADAVFGTNVSADENDDWIDVYAHYDVERGCVCSALDINLVRVDGAGLYCQYRLTSEECADLRNRMDDYCKQTMGRSLDEYRTQYLAQEQGTASQEPLSGPTLQM